jgi:hypothetical protein
MHKKERRAGQEPLVTHTYIVTWKTEITRIWVLGQWGVGRRVETLSLRKNLAEVACACDLRD